MSLGAIISADRGEKAVKSIVYDLEVAMSRRGPDRRDHGWHPSQLMDMCPRFEILRRLVKDDLQEETDRPNTRTQFIFDIGTALHAWWQEQYFGPMQVLKGKWRCIRCGYKTSATSLMPKRPHYCGDVNEDADGNPLEVAGSNELKVGHNHHWKFDEVSVRSEEWGVVGHSDGIYVLGKESLCEEDVVLDIKTAGPTFWNGGARPYPSNIFQINLYMWLLGLKKGVLLYVDKGGVDKSLTTMCKEVVVDYNDTHRKDACAKIEAYRDGARTRTLPSRMATCELRPRSAKPKGCPLSSICLSDKKSGEVEKTWGDVEIL
jgi:hypothetical protein